ncbi:hypothetical protein R1sor_000207 [Riccia sorocarpa]|uniref:carotenoid 9,10-dioxygenase n=1 Tax=Riccia sorocarpa TaxID=122646 RepID=A0ABD3GSG0_9MARC
MAYSGLNASKQGKYNGVVSDDIGKEKQLGVLQLAAAKVVDAIESAAVWVIFGGKVPQSYYVSGNYGPVEEFGPAHSVPVDGAFPECLNGEFVRVGPNPKYKPVGNYHWFDGDGMIHGLRIKDGKVSYVCRYVRTAKLAQEDYWGASKFIKIGDLIGKQGILWPNLFKLRKKLGIVDDTNGTGTANTAMVYHNGRLLALNEGDKPYAVRLLEEGDLETIGRVDYEKKLNHSFTAHPKIDPDTGEMFTFGATREGPPYVTYRVVSKDGEMGEPVPLTVSGPIMMHDMALTENYSLFLDCPLYFNPKDMVKKNQCIFSFDDTKPARLGVLPRYAKNESQIQWFTVSTCVIFHNANAWEEGDEVVLITCRIPSIDLVALAVYDEVKAKKFANDLWEYRLNLKTGEAKEKKLGEFRSDFPRINEEYVGRKNRYVYNCIFDDATHISAIAKYDLTREPELGKEKLELGGNVVGIVWHGKGRYGSEAVFVPKNPGREGDEDDGYLICFVHDEKTGKSEVVVIDAKTMSSEFVAVALLPTRVPYGFHAMPCYRGKALKGSEEQIKKQRL